ncbi:MAG TPA: alanine dehydrogenase [Polyangiaceae bacterium LLY-WYZ-14_1]|nr:alanine dehydrogenase [Polyangiaceae bacterium LLY-WYZ-14_1]
MKIGVPKEVKTREYRVGINPGGVRDLVSAGHQVLIETRAGDGSGIPDGAFAEAGATIVPRAADAWGADLVMKVKEPLPSEYGFFRPGLVLFTYLHLAPLPELTRELMDKKVRAIAYETIQGEDGGLPLLRPMSEVAGRMATQVGATCLEKERGGKGILLGGVPGTRRGRVVILGGGIVGSNAARIAVGLGAQVTVLETNHDRMAFLEDVFGGAIETLYSNPQTIDECVRQADLVIGAVLVTGARAPRLVTRDHIRGMSPGSVVVDVSVDQGGCIETCRPTTHDEPTFEVDGVVHYCVPNMPGAVPYTSTFALTNVTLRYARLIADLGAEMAIRSHPRLSLGVNTWDGACTYEGVALGVGVDFTPLDRLI